MPDPARILSTLRDAGLLRRDRVELRPAAVVFREFGRPYVVLSLGGSGWRVLRDDGTTLEVMKGEPIDFVRWYFAQPVRIRHAA